VYLQTNPSEFEPERNVKSHLLARSYRKSSNPDKFKASKIFEELKEFLPSPTTSSYFTTTTKHRIINILEGNGLNNVSINLVILLISEVIRDNRQTRLFNLGETAKQKSISPIEPTTHVQKSSLFPVAELTFTKSIVRNWLPAWIHSSRKVRHYEDINEEINNEDSHPPEFIYAVDTICAMGCISEDLIVTVSRSEIIFEALKDLNEEDRKILVNKFGPPWLDKVSLLYKLDRYDKYKDKDIDRFFYQYVFMSSACFNFNKYIEPNKIIDWAKSHYTYKKSLDREKFFESLFKERECVGTFTNIICECDDHE